MKKKTIAVLVVLSLLALPVMASAAAEFTLGGYLKLHVFYDSSFTDKNLSSPIARDNHPSNQHGRLQFTSQSSRFNFTIKGPEVLGAKTTGFLEMDFDNGDARLTTSTSHVPRLRHAMFRMNWPEWELLMGQYWSMFSEFTPDFVEDGAFQINGAPSARLPQIRGTFKFSPMWAKEDSMRFALLVGKASDTADAVVAGENDLPGQQTETPQVQGLVGYEADLWGKGPFYSKPRGFVFQVAAGWQRTRYRDGDFTARFIDSGAGDFFTIAASDPDQHYLNNWMVMGTLFIPIIPTHTQNLAGTAALTAQYFVGEGTEAFGNTGGFSKFTNSAAFDPDTFERNLVKRWGGYLMGTYCFTNEWYVNAGWAYTRTFDLNLSTLGSGIGDAFNVDPWKYTNEACVAVFYRPVTALKFGLQYTWMQTKYYQDLVEGSKNENKGTNHRVQFAGWFFF